MGKKEDEMSAQETIEHYGADYIYEEVGNRRMDKDETFVKSATFNYHTATIKSELSALRVENERLSKYLDKANSLIHFDFDKASTGAVMNHSNELQEYRLTHPKETK